MPLDARLLLWNCPAYRAVLQPKPGDRPACFAPCLSPDHGPLYA